MCANCRYLREDRKSCGNKYFIRWHGSAEIPGEIDAYCSDWWMPKTEKSRMAESFK